MFYSCHHPSIRYNGRFAEVCGNMTATACGAGFTIAFSGKSILLQLDVSGCQHPLPHLWLQLDDGAKVEVPLDKYLRLECAEGEHLLTVTLKSAKETQHRFYHPLQSKLALVGYEAEGCGALPADTRKTMELVGDSITEGVLIDAHLVGAPGNDQNNRPYQDDATATYGHLAAEKLGLRPLHMGYGAVGATKGGNGGVPKAAEAYPFCFDGAPVTYPHPDYVLINHGANDRKATDEQYIFDYDKLLNVIRAAHPDAVIICLSAFVGSHNEALADYIAHRRQQDDKLHFIDGSHWVPKEPLHPLRAAHAYIAEQLANELQKIL